MTRLEGIQARAYLQQQELLKTPAGRLALESAQRNKQRIVDKEYLKQFEAGYFPDLTGDIRFERQKTDEEMMIEQALENFM